MNKDKIFAAGMRFEKPQEGAPEFIKGRLSFKVAEAVEFLKKYENGGGWVNVDLKKSKEGKLYLELNTYKKEETKEPYKSSLTEEEKAILKAHRDGTQNRAKGDEDPSEIPF